MNMIAGAKVSIVDPTPGVTRDRVTAIVELQPPFRESGKVKPYKPVEFVDTGGFGAYTAPGERFDEVGEDLHTLTNSIEFQIGQAVGDADLVLFVLDAQSGPTPVDLTIATLLRERRLGPGAKGGKIAAKAAAERAQTKSKGSPLVAKKPAKAAAAAVEIEGKSASKGPEIRVVANKTDGPRWEAHAQEIAGLGFGEPLMISAKSNYMRREFLDALYDALPAYKPAPEPKVDLRVAIVGKRNAGKSTLVNTLAGEPRVIVSEIAGTTRDAIDVRFDLDIKGQDRSVLVIDTAGVRRAKSFQNMIEHYAFDRVKRSIDRADVALLMIDSTAKISQVDEQVAMLLQKTFTPTIIVVNKWDLVEGKPNRKGVPITTADYETYLRKELGGLTYAPIAFISGKSGRNVRATINLAFELGEQAATRVTTGVLNRFVRRIMETRAPSDTTGKHAKVYYVAQTGVRPPTITMVVNDPELMHNNFLRFMMNRFREELPFVEVPVKIVVRPRKQREGDLALDTATHVALREGVQKGGIKRDRGDRRIVRGIELGTKPEAFVADAPDRELTDAELNELAGEPTSYFNDDYKSKFSKSGDLGGDLGNQAELYFDED